MIDEPKACTTCAFHHFERMGHSGIHLCTIRDAMPSDPGDERTPAEREESDQNFLGWDCDAARRMGQLCGPRAELWTRPEFVHDRAIKS